MSAAGGPQGRVSARPSGRRRLSWPAPRAQGGRAALAAAGRVVAARESASPLGFPRPALDAGSRERVRTCCAQPLGTGDQGAGTGRGERGERGAASWGPSGVSGKLGGARRGAASRGPASGARGPGRGGRVLVCTLLSFEL